AGPNFKCSGRAFGGTSRASGGSVRRDPEGTRSCAHSGAAAAASASTASTRGVCGPDISVPEDSLDLEVLLEPEHPVLAAVARLAVAAERGMTRPGRSEERRVGKGCRPRGLPCRYKRAHMTAV